MGMEPFNPLEKRSLAESVVQALLKRPCHPLPPSDPFVGAGIYALYYSGPFPPYEPIAQKNSGGRCEQPIYVGKAVPQGARKGRFGLDPCLGDVLFRRLKEHAQSIEQAENLELADFSCRYLIVDEIWIPLAEQFLIEVFSPIWNVVIDGFGNHDPGAGRYNQKKSAWDVLHPGRPWAAKLQPSDSTREELVERVACAFRVDTSSP